MTGWLISLRDRPIAESERGAAMATVTVLLIAATILLALSQPGGQSRRTSQRRASSSVVQNRPSVDRRASENGTAPLTSELARAANLFLAGYLGYLYGRVPASQVKGATTALLRSLRSHRPRVSPGMRARRPRIVALHSTPAPSGLLVVSALVNDGGLVNYSIGLLLVPRGGRLLVSGLEGGE
ncbi:MAG: hypothetical protein ACHQC8_01985 [Solirubrobacterales bacterium]